MIEVRYNENGQDEETLNGEGTGEKEIRSLKNVRQIGPTNGKGRIYIEDKVKSYIDRHRKAKRVCCIALLGKEQRQEGVRFFIDGAMIMEQVEILGSEVSVPEQMRRMAEAQRQQYFPQLIVLGFYLPTYSHVLDMVTAWDTQPCVYMTQDENEEEVFYIWEHSRFLRQSGYYIYYEENKAMEEYEALYPAPKIRRETGRKQRAAGRRSGREQSVKKEIPVETMTEQREGFFWSVNGWLYGASAAMVLVVLVVGVTLMNNYEKMRELQQSMDTIVQAVSGNRIIANISEPSSTQLPVESSTPQPTKEAEVIDTISPSEKDTFGEEYESGYQVYTIREGDTLFSISREQYQSEEQVEAICQLNDIDSENKLIVGEKILLP